MEISASFSLYQLFVPLLAILMIAKECSRFIRKQCSIRELITWIIVWSILSVIALFPDMTIQNFAKWTGIKNGINALIFFLLIIMGYAILKLFMLLEEQDRKITDLTRYLALTKTKKNENRPHRRRS